VIRNAPQLATMSLLFLNNYRSSENWGYKIIMVDSRLINYYLG